MRHIRLTWTPEEISSGLDKEHCGTNGYWCDNCWTKWYQKNPILKQLKDDDGAKELEASKFTKPFPTPGTNPKLQNLWTALANEPDKGAGKRKRVAHFVDALKAILGTQMPKLFPFRPRPFDVQFAPVPLMPLSSRSF